MKTNRVAGVIALAFAIAAGAAAQQPPPPPQVVVKPYSTITSSPVSQSGTATLTCQTGVVRVAWNNVTAPNEIAGRPPVPKLESFTLTLENQGGATFDATPVVRDLVFSHLGAITSVETKCGIDRLGDLKHNGIVSVNFRGTPRKPDTERIRACREAKGRMDSYDFSVSVWLAPDRVLEQNNWLPACIYPNPEAVPKPR